MVCSRTAFPYLISKRTEIYIVIFRIIQDATFLIEHVAQVLLISLKELLI